MLYENGQLDYKISIIFKQLICAVQIVKATLHIGVRQPLLTGIALVRRSVYEHSLNNYLQNVKTVLYMNAQVIL